MEATDETQITEITLQPDGRVYVFGTSRGMLEVLRELAPQDAHVTALLNQAPATDSFPSDPSA